jgi:spore germination protein GerM
MLLVGIVLLATLLGVLFLRKYAGREPVAPPQQTASVPAEGVRSVVLFFASPDGSGLVRESREIDPCDGLVECAEDVIGELINGPLGDFSPTLPETATYRTVSVNGDLLTVDFGKEMQDGVQNGSNAEMVAVYSVVNSLTANFPEIKRVLFLVEGKPVETLKGHLDLREPLLPDYSLENTGVTPKVETAPKRREQ